MIGPRRNRLVRCGLGVLLLLTAPVASGAEPSEEAPPERARPPAEASESRLRAQALVRRGQELAAMGRRQEALRAFAGALDAYQAYPLAHHEMGVTFAEMGDLVEAEASLTKALAMAPDFIRARQALAEVLRRRSQFDEALEHYRRALNQAPEDLASWYGAAAALRARGDDAEARYALEQLVAAAENKSAPAVVEAEKEIAALEASGVTAEVWGTDVEPEQPGEGTTVATRKRRAGSLTRHEGDQFFSERRYLAALEAYRGVWSDEEPDVVLAYKIGATFAVMNDDRQALRWWRRALAIDPGRELIARHLAVLVAKLRSTDDQEETESEDAPEGASNDQVLVARDALRSGDPATALYLVDGSDRPGAAAIEAEARLRLGDFERALAIFEELLGSDPEDRVAKGGIAETLLRMGQAARAEEAIGDWVGREVSERGYKARPEAFLVFRRGEVDARLLAPLEPEE